MGKTIKNLTRSHSPSLEKSLAVSKTDKYLYSAEGGSIAILDTTDYTTFSATNGIKKFPVGDRGVLPVRMLYDPLGAVEPHYKDYIYVAGGRDGFWSVGAGVNVAGDGPTPSEALQSSNRATRLDDRQVWNSSTQNNIRFCNDVKLMEFGGVKYLAVLFQALDDTRLRIYNLATLDLSANASVDADEETGHEVVALGEAVLGKHSNASLTDPTTSLWGSIGLGMTVSGSDVYVAMGTNGIVKVDFSDPANPGTPEWGPIFGTGTNYATVTTNIPSYKSRLIYGNLVFSGYDGATVREERPIFSDVATDTVNGKLYAAMENLGWVQFDLAPTWTSSLAITHHEGSGVEGEGASDPQPYLFRLRSNNDGTYVRTLDIKESYNSSYGPILGISGNKRTLLTGYTGVRTPGVSYHPSFGWNGFLGHEGYPPVAGKGTTCLYVTSSLVGGDFNNTSRNWVGGLDLILSTSATNGNWMNVFTNGNRYWAADGSEVINAAHSHPMTINWWASNSPGTESTASVVSLAVDTSGERDATVSMRGTVTFGAEPCIKNKKVLLHGGNDGYLNNTGFLVRGSDDTGSIIKAWDVDALPSEGSVDLDLGIRATKFAQYNITSDILCAIGERKSRKRTDNSDVFGYWGFKTFSVSANSFFRDEPEVLGEHALKYPNNSFGSISKRPYYGTASRSETFDNYCINPPPGTDPSKPFMWLNATNTPEGLIMLDSHYLQVVRNKPFSDPYEDDAQDLLNTDPNIFTAFETHPEVSGMDRGSTDASGFFRHKAGFTPIPFISWLPNIFSVTDPGSGGDKMIMCIPCHTIVNYPNLVSHVDRFYSKSGTSTPLTPHHRCDLSAVWETTNHDLSSNYDHGMALFFDLTNYQNFPKGGSNPVQSNLPRIILPNNPSAVWQVENVMLDNIVYVVVLDMMGSVYVYNAAHIFNSPTTLTPVTSWDASASNFDKGNNNGFSIAIDKVNSTDTSAHIYVGIKRLGVEVLILNPEESLSADKLTHQELIKTWDSPHNIVIEGNGDARTMLVSDYAGGIREFSFATEEIEGAP